MNKYIPAVKRGIKFLDENVPDWHDRVDVQKLDLGSCQECILGQLYGSFDDGYRELGLSTIESAELGLDSQPVSLPVADYHFFDGMISGEYGLLTEAWKLALDK